MCATRRRSFALLCLVAWTTGCFYTTAPKGFLPTAQAAQQDAFGGWVRAELADNITMEGELLAVTADTLHLLTSASGWMALPLSQVRMATLTGYDMWLQPFIGWGVGGTLSALSHGFFLLFSMPLWIITSSSAAASASRAPRIRSLDPAQLAPFARFPQGLPVDIDRSTIRSKFAASP
jgi:hypothetical protein